MAAHTTKDCGRRWHTFCQNQVRYYGAAIDSVCDAVCITSHHPHACVDQAGRNRSREHVYYSTQ
ncbi:hypothetical protein MINTM016_23920 [Mycobacterium intracellulare]|uniref:Uncharacterized protein n=2 Tax=Mycobacterium TaxID=1763 RepID=A0A7R7MUC0_MYCIT|nr:hypothetical protein MINTM016_23920 [Mycobacterium intracellulare]BCO99658.1 hypothetical protein MINTM018_24280 [Mycobacterium intracellulare]SOX54598.1 hypothetical protein MAAFP003_3275 [Mycobacterium ahvazicum]